MTDTSSETPDIHKLRSWHRELAYAEVIQAVEALPQPLSGEHTLLYGLSLAMSGDTARGRPLLRSALERDNAHVPHHHDFLSDLALAALLLGRLEEAATSLVTLSQADQACAVDISRLAAVRLAQNQLEDAAALYREALDRDPQRAQWQVNRASVLTRMQRWDDAQEAYEAALRLAPTLPQAINGKRALMPILERGEELVEELQTSLTRDPDNPETRFALARALQRQNRFTEAMHCLLDGLVPAQELRRWKDSDAERFASHRGTQLQLREAVADAWAERGMSRRALHAYDEAQALFGVYAGQLAVKAVQALIDCGELDTAQQRLAEFEADQGEILQTQLLRSQILVERADYAGAEDLLRGLINTYPGQAGLQCQLGQALLWTGQLDEAAALFRNASALNPMALAQLSRARRWPEDPRVLERMRSVADNPLLPPAARIAMAFALAESFDRAQDYDSAATYLQSANTLSAPQLGYRPEAFSQLIDRTMNVFNRNYFKAMGPTRSTDRRVVFIVGMPRSGTTLVEQILSAHPQIFGAGELDVVPQLTRLIPKVLHSETPYPECVPALSPALREEAARHLLHALNLHDTEHSVVVDKLPHNFVNLGLIASVLPNARIVHLRRDPRDVGLSNFQQNFKARQGGMGFAFDLKHIAAQLNDYARIMAHWRDVLPIPILTVDYESLVADQLLESERLLSFLDLPWDDAVVAFNQLGRPVRTASVAQVREPIYSSSCGKWRRYEGLLQPLMEALSATALEGYDVPRQDLKGRHPKGQD